MLKFSLPVLVLATTLLAPIAPTFACDTWSVPGDLAIQQQNGYAVSVRHATLNGKTLSGDAKYSGGRGDLDGSISKNGRLHFNITWDNGSVGVYTASVDDDGTVQDGRTYDKTHPANWSTFTMDALSCDD